MKTSDKAGKARLRSQAWFDNPANPDMTALYLERYLNYGLTREELQSGKPIIGIAQTGSDLSPCNRPLIELAKRAREGIREAGGIAIEFPVHPIQETGKRPTAALDRNLAYLGLVEILFGYPLDGVILTTGCDKTTPACLMAAATVDIPAIVLTGGPMLNGWYKGKRAGSGSVIWQGRQQLAEGQIDYDEFIAMAAASAPSAGFCNTMGTAMTMNSLAEALGMSLPGSAAIPAPYRERAQVAYETGKRIVALVEQDIKPSAIMTRDAFENAIMVNSALGGSTNAPVHITAIARHMGIDLPITDWQRLGHQIPLLVNMQPVGTYLSEDFHRAGGVGAVIGSLLRQGLLHGSCQTVAGASIASLYQDWPVLDADVIKDFAAPVLRDAGFLILTGNLFDSAVMKTSAISPAFRARYLSDPQDPNAMTLKAFVFDGPEDYHRRIDDPALAIDAQSLLVMRYCGPIGFPGSGEVVNMRPPNYLIAQGVDSLPCMGDGRQSGTSASPSILNASPEAAAGGGLALLQDGDLVRIDLAAATANALVAADVWAKRKAALAGQEGLHPAVPAAQTPWQQLQRPLVDSLSDGMVLRDALAFQQIAGKGLPRDNH